MEWLCLDFLVEEDSLVCCYYHYPVVSLLKVLPVLAALALALRSLAWSELCPESGELVEAVHLVVHLSVYLHLFPLHHV